MLSWEVWMEIKQLSKEGHSIKAITRLTGHSRNTVRRVLRQPQPTAFKKPSRQSLLDEFKPYITKRYQECALSSVRLFAEIKPMGYRGSLATLRRFTQQLQAQRRAQSKLTVRYETPPGQQSQADWSYCGRFPDQLGKLISVMSLSWCSRFRACSMWSLRVP